METERATIELLKEVFPNSLVGLEVTYGQLPSNLKARKTFNYIKTMAREPYIDQDAALTLQESVYKVKHTPSPQGCTALLQQYEKYPTPVERNPPRIVAWKTRIP